MSGLGMAAGGGTVLITLAALALLLFLLASWLGRWSLWAGAYLLVAATLAAAFFFRDPVRTGVREPHLFLAPADGRVVAVGRVPEPEYLRGPALRIVIDPALLDVHVQRSPVDGVVDYVARRPRGSAVDGTGAASGAGATSIGINSGEVRVLVRQVAGTLTRRMVVHAEEGDRVSQGERIGLIGIGSRVETYLPADASVDVEVGDRVRAGKTILGCTRGAAIAPAGGTGP